MHRPLLAVVTLSVALPLTVAGQDAPAQRANARGTTAGVQYSHTRFGGAQDPWHLMALSLATRRTRGAFMTRLNLARRFAIGGSQLEVEAYPRLGQGKRGYLNAGYSRATIFPEQRYGAEFFTALPHAYETSFGVRNLRFSTEQVTLFTGSVARSSGNRWVSLRPYVRRKTGKLSASASLSGRRYYEDGDSFIGVLLGAGSAPTDGVEPSQLGREKWWAVRLDAARPASKRVTTTWLVKYERDKILTQALHRLEFGGGVAIGF